MPKSPWFNEDHELFRQSVRQFIDTEVFPEAASWEKQGFIPTSMWTRMGELGLLGVPHKEEDGGLGADFFHSVILLEEVARSTMGGFSAAVSVHMYMATAHIAKVGSPVLKEKFLRPAITGEKWGALGISEPFAGSDVASIRTTAVREGDHYVINGSKTFITNGVEGDFVTLACKTDPDAGAAGISLIIVEKGTPGFTASNLDKMGWHSSDTGELAFDDVRVPVENLVGQENQGFYYIMDSFQLERLVAAALAIGGAEKAIEMAMQYMDEREVFGRKINRFQALRHRLVDRLTELEAARQLTYFTAWKHEQGDFAVRECSMAKLLTAELGKKVADDCLQVFGGYGFMEEYPIARMYRDARAGTIVGGTSEIMREILAKMTFDGVRYDSAYEEGGDQTNITARDIMLGLPERFRTEKAASADAIFHFDLAGDGGGKFTVAVKPDGCSVQEGLSGEAACTISAASMDYVALEQGRLDPQAALMGGKIKVSDMGAMMSFMPLFHGLQKAS